MSDVYTEEELEHDRFPMFEKKVMEAKIAAKYKGIKVENKTYVNTVKDYLRCSQMFLQSFEYP